MDFIKSNCKSSFLKFECIASYISLQVLSKASHIVWCQGMSHLYSNATLPSKHCGYSTTLAQNCLASSKTKSHHHLNVLPSSALATYLFQKVPSLVPNLLEQKNGTQPHLKEVNVPIDIYPLRKC